MKYYTLKKDLPTFKAGEKFYISAKGNLVSVEKEPLVAYSRRTLEKFPNILTDWFEKVNIGFYLDEGGYTVEYDYNGYSYYLDYRKSIGNDFKTEEEVAEYKEYLKALQTIKDDTKGFVPDWENWGQIKYYAYYDHSNGFLGWCDARRFQNQGTIYFNSEKDIEKSFKKHRKEWLIVLGVENEDND